MPSGKTQKGDSNGSNNANGTITFGGGGSNTGNNQQNNQIIVSYSAGLGGYKSVTNSAMLEHPNGAIDQYVTTTKITRWGAPRK